MQFNSVVNAGESLNSLSKMQLPSQDMAPKSPAAGKMENSFKNALKGMISEANSGQVEAKEAISQMASGENVSIHGTMIAIEKADISLRLTTQVRNKAVEAYREIMQMQI